jgi:hypothetical protein
MPDLIEKCASSFIRASSLYLLAKIGISLNLWLATPPALRTTLPSMISRIVRSCVWADSRTSNSGISRTIWRAVDRPVWLIATTKSGRFSGPQIPDEIPQSFDAPSVHSAELYGRLTSGGSNTKPSPTAWRKPATALHLHPLAAKPVAQRAHHQRDRTATRGRAQDQNADCAAVGGHGRHCCSGRCLLPVRSTCARSMAGKPLPQNPSISNLISPHNMIELVYWRLCRFLFQPRSGRDSLSRFSVSLRGGSWVEPA